MKKAPDSWFLIYDGEEAVAKANVFKKTLSFSEFRDDRKVMTEAQYQRHFGPDTGYENVYAYHNGFYIGVCDRGFCVPLDRSDYDSDYLFPLEVRLYCYYLWNECYQVPERLVNTLVNIAESASMLSDVGTTWDDEWRDYDDVLNTNYPFMSSLDEQAKGIVEWVISSCNKLHNLYEKVSV